MQTWMGVSLRGCLGVSLPSSHCLFQPGHQHSSSPALFCKDTCYLGGSVTWVGRRGGSQVWLVRACGSISRGGCQLPGPSLTVIPPFLEPR